MSTPEKRTPRKEDSLEKLPRPCSLEMKDTAAQQQIRSMMDDATGEILIMAGAGTASPYHRRTKSPAAVAREVSSATKQMQVVADLFTKGNEADHALGRSLHPFDVLSWTKECKDEDIENTLTRFAEVAEADVKELKNDLISCRPFVLREVKDGNDLLESWKKAVVVFKDRLAELPKAMYAMIAIWRGTGALESLFHIGKQQPSKNCMKDDQFKNRMRIRMNGCSLEEFCKKKVVEGKVQFEPGPLCLLAQNLYASTYGSLRVMFDGSLTWCLLHCEFRKNNNL